MEKYLVVSEVSKKQSYIFKSNKLKENIGASVIIEYVTEDLPKIYLTKYNGERVYEGGGSSLFLFNEESDAKNFIRGLTTHVLKEFPGVEYFMAFQKFDNSCEDITKVIDKLYKKLNDKKSKRQSVFKRYSYGVEEKCNTTTLPAHLLNKDREEKEYLSREATVKRYWSNQNKIKDIKQTTIDEILSVFTNQNNPTQYKFSAEIEQLGIKKGENSYIAIVSLDGNKMGKKLEAFKNNNKKSQNQSYEDFNSKYTKSLYNFSKSIKLAYKESFIYMIEKIIENYDKLRKDKKFSLSENIVPIRPIILAGDDVCFICNANIALECVNFFIEHLKTKKVEKFSLNACAGISIVKESYPFTKSYDIAENLCKSSKAKLKENEDYSLLDWHISQGEISSSLFDIREKVHVKKDIKLNIKPLYITNEKIYSGEKEIYATYNNFKKELLKIRKFEEKSRNKLKTLREIFPQGKEATRIYMNKYKIEKEFSMGFGLEESEFGFEGNNCLYFDIIETIDLFKDLD